MKTIFEETQKFRQKWIWILLIILFIFSTGLHLLPLFQNLSVEELKTLIIGNSISFIIFLSVILLFYLLKMNTKITSEGIEMTYTSFFTRKLAWQEIEKAEVIDYGFVGGWGIRLWTEYGTVYNIAGSKGLHIKLKNGKQLLIGSQKIDELKKALKEITKLED